MPDMAMIISFINIKGGVGKTTLVANTADALHRFGKHVLMVDLDMQSNLTDIATADLDSIKHTAYELFMDEDLMAAQVCVPSIIDDCDIITSDLRLITVEPQITAERKPNAYTLLAEKLDNVCRETYDYILIDCHPDMSLLTMNALMASTHYIIPVKPDRHSTRGIGITDVYIERVRKANKTLREIGILINDYDARTTISKVTQELLTNKFPQRVMTTIIGTNAPIATAAAKRMTVFQFERRANSCKDFRELAVEIMGKVGDSYGEETA
jgi:chromosome partitioning protein